MRPRVLLLGGTTEARAMAEALRDASVDATLSLAGRVANPLQQALPTRVGGFGGVDGLRAYLSDTGITHVIDATHPFAAHMSGNATAACAAAGVPLIALTRPAWSAGPSDRWQRVSSLEAAADTLSGAARVVFLAVGRMHLGVFAGQPQHRYILRLVDAGGAIPLPDHQAEIARGPFRHDDDLALMRQHGVQVVVSKNSGGTGAYAKISAARALGLPVIMVDRPALTPRHEVGEVAQVMAWLNVHPGTERGV